MFLFTIYVNAILFKLIAFARNRKSFAIAILVFAFECNAKNLAIVILVFLKFFLLLFFRLVTVSGRTGKSFTRNFRHLFLQICVTKPGSPSKDILTNYCVYFLKFLVRAHGIPCALEINSNVGFKRGQWNHALQPLKKS